MQSVFFKFNFVLIFLNNKKIYKHEKKCIYKIFINYDI